MLIYGIDYGYIRLNARVDCESPHDPRLCKNEAVVWILGTVKNTGQPVFIPCCYKHIPLGKRQVRVTTPGKWVETTRYLGQEEYAYAD